MKNEYLKLGMELLIQFISLSNTHQFKCHKKKMHILRTKFCQTTFTLQNTLNRF